MSCPKSRLSVDVSRPTRFSSLRPLPTTVDIVDSRHAPDDRPLALPLDPGAYTFNHDIRVRFAETDAMGIVHHSCYLPYLEEARVAYMRSIGHPYTANREAGLDAAVIECRLRYLAPLRFDDVVTVHLRVGGTTRATFTIEYLLTIGSQPTTIAVTQHAFVTADGRPRRLPDWLRNLAVD